MKVLLIAGARPNFMKIAPIYRELFASSGNVVGIMQTVRGALGQGL